MKGLNLEGLARYLLEVTTNSNIFSRASGDDCTGDDDCDTECCYKQVCFEYSQCKTAKIFMWVMIVLFVLIFIAGVVIVYLCCKKRSLDEKLKQIRVT